MYLSWFHGKDKFQSIHFHSSPTCPTGLGKLFLTEGWKQMRTCLCFADVQERSFPEFLFGESRPFDLHKSDCVFPFTCTLLIYIPPYWLTSSWRVKNHSSDSRMTVSPFWLFFRTCFFMTTLILISAVSPPMTGLKNGAHLGVLPVDLFSSHVGEVKTYLWHKTLYGIWVPKIFQKSIIFVKEIKCSKVLAY